MCKITLQYLLTTTRKQTPMKRALSNSSSKAIYRINCECFKHVCEVWCEVSHNFQTSINLTLKAPTKAELSRVPFHNRVLFSIKCAYSVSGKIGFDSYMCRQ